MAGLGSRILLISFFALEENHGGDMNSALKICQPKWGKEKKRKRNTQGSTYHETENMDCNEGKNAPITSIFVISGFNLAISTETCNLTPLRRE